MKLNTLRLEEIAINAFPAILTEVYDGWVLRYSNGYTYRGNSVNPLYLSSLSLESKVIHCEDRYFNKGLPCVFKMTENAGTELDSILEQRGYEIQKEADIMAMPITKFTSIDLSDVTCEHKINDLWLEDYIILNGNQNEPMKTTAKIIHMNIGNPVICASIYENNEMAACGLGVYEDGQVGLYDIKVLEKYRRKGYGTKICQKILEEGIILGAHTAYLQVVVKNDVAISMYSKMGFKKVYTYWYRVLPNYKYN